jgi:hypothetical protein
MGVITVGRADGRQVRRYVTARSRAAVVEKLDALRSAQNAGVSAPNSRTTVGEYLTRWLADIVPDSVGSVNTLDNYEWAVRLHLIPALGHRPLVKLTPGGRG